MKSKFVDAGLAIAAGDSAPPGATVAAGGVNFSVFSKDADLVELRLFDDPQATEAAETIPLDPRAHRTYHYWHAFVPGLSESSRTHARVEGWRRCIDTAQASPNDILPLEHAPLVTASTIVAQPRSIVVLAQVVHDVLGAPR